MIAELQQAHADRVKLAPDYLKMFIRLGSAKVRHKIADLIRLNSTAASLLDRDALFGLLLQQVRESIDRLDSDAFSDSGCLFLSKLYGYILRDDQRQNLLQTFIDAITPFALRNDINVVHREYVLKQLLHGFPEVLRGRAYGLSPRLHAALFEITHRYDAYKDTIQTRTHHGKR